MYQLHLLTLPDIYYVTGVFFACSVAGPGIGFIAGGALTSLYTNLGER